MGEEQQSRYNSWNVNMNNGNSNNNRNNSNRVRPVAFADEQVAYDISLESIVEAFEDCCRKKKTSNDYLQFLPRYQSELVRIWEDIRYARYVPGKSKCFVVEWPVHREVFAADFADRIVHHWWSLLKHYNTSKSLSHL